MTPSIAATTASTAGPPTVDELDGHRRELTGFCYRMLGSGSEAEDAVQETMLRAWRAADRFEGRSSVRTWLFRIAANVCVDLGRSPQRRARPIDLGPAREPDPVHLADVLPDGSWVSPIPTTSLVEPGADPAEVVATRDTVRLAFVSALQYLPAKQRAALVLCDVLRWPAADVADLLDTSTASVNSALQRARARLDELPVGTPPAPHPSEAALLTRYVDAFERYDVDALARLFRDDVVQTMPPYAMWLRGVDDVLTWYIGPGKGCRGSRLVATSTNGHPAFAQYRVDPDGGHTAWSLQLLELDGDRIGAVHAFLDTTEFARFGLPLHLPEDRPAADDAAV